MKEQEYLAHLKKKKVTLNGRETLSVETAQIMTWFSWPNFQHRNWFVWVVDLLCCSTGWAESCIGESVQSLGLLCFVNREFFPVYPKNQTGKLWWTFTCPCGTDVIYFRNMLQKTDHQGIWCPNPERIFLMLSGTQAWSAGSSPVQGYPTWIQ